MKESNRFYLGFYVVEKKKKGLKIEKIIHISRTLYIFYRFQMRSYPAETNTSYLVRFNQEVGLV